MSDDLSLFGREEAILEESRVCLDRHSQALERACLIMNNEDCQRFEDMQGLVASYGKLLADYGRLYKQSSRLVNLSDRLQRRINETNQALLASQDQLEVRNRFIRNTFGRYLSDEVVSNLLDSPTGLDMGGSKREVTVMMTDLRGFTALCERLPAESVVMLLNLYFAEMVEIIAQYKGTIMGMFGDGLMVVFGAPQHLPDHAGQAVACALRLQLAMPAVNERAHARGLTDPLSMGIGINTGPVVAGNIGSEKRSKYSVIGNNVNLAARIESLTVGGQVLISESTLAACGRERLRVDDVMTANLKGIRLDTTVYRIGAIHGDDQPALPLPRDALTPVASHPIRFVSMDGKVAHPTPLEGHIVALAGDLFDLECRQELSLFANLKILPDEERDDREGGQYTYGKIIGQTRHSPHLYRVGITVCSPEMKALFDKLTPTVVD
ncbi:MAG: adenylate/guanylate cyclase domain-containing protein [Magnetococcales bacterium]|nr:adenylate/guanylate cyclase domain-containing protein [Magnetococcales bacterium]